MLTTHSSTPLMSLDAVVLDTETTGLDVKKARVIQIGAVRISQGELRANSTLDLLVDPRSPIPPETTAVHGIADKDVASAPVFGDVAPRLEAFTGRSVVIGHNIAFDLSVLSDEYVRSGLSWRRPRSLDTLILARIARSSLADYSLDSVSAWLGIKIKGRHTALGDALATARMFIALVPMLRAEGIRTLAEAEAASRAFSDLFEGYARSGWIEPILPREDARIAPSALAQIDPFLFHSKVRDLMGAPPVFAPASWTARKASRLLAERGISSVFVEPSPRSKDKAMGIVTERDLMRELARPASANRRLGQIMSKPLMTIAQDRFLYQALGRMRRLKVRHLGVTGAGGAIVGALTNGDLLKQRAADAIVLGDEFEHAENTAALGALWSRVPVIARKLVAEDISPRHICAVIAEELCAVTRRAAELAEREMIAQGHGAPPAPYVLLVLGSGGRGETLLAPDQDNAIIYEKGEPGGAVDSWFRELGTLISDILNDIGIPYCNGGVMASSDAWRHSLSAWKTLVDDWLGRSGWKDLCYVDIFYDFKPVHGDARLAGEIWRYAYRHAHRSPGFLKLLAMVATELSAPVGIFGNIRTSQGRVDAKKQCLLQLVGGARVLALRNGVERRSTLERLEGVRALGKENANDLNSIMEAHELLLGEILRQQLIDADAGLPLGNKIELKRLSRRERKRLKSALSQVDVMNTLVGDPQAFG